MNEQCERREISPGEWVCDACTALWFGELAKTEFRPSECRSPPVPSHHRGTP